MYWLLNELSNEKRPSSPSRNIENSSNTLANSIFNSMFILCSGSNQFGVISSNVTDTFSHKVVNQMDYFIKQSMCIKERSWRMCIKGPGARLLTLIFSIDT